MGDAGDRQPVLVGLVGERHSVARLRHVFAEFLQPGEVVVAGHLVEERFAQSPRSPVRVPAHRMGNGPCRHCHINELYCFSLESCPEPPATIPAAYNKRLVIRPTGHPKPRTASTLGSGMSFDPRVAFRFRARRFVPALQPPDQIGFAVHPRRWVVERFFSRNRRLWKDPEATLASARAFLYAASVMLLARRLARLS